MHISILVKPASSLCNMDCSYCFYKDLATHRQTYSHGIMGEVVMKSLISKAFTRRRRSVHFIFQGGEPTLAGFAYYKTFIDLVKQYNRQEIPVYYSLQTNGYQLSEELLDFFKKEDFLLGISLDGPKEIHDKKRPSLSGEGTYDKIIKNMERIKEKAIPFNILTVVDHDHAKEVEKIYNHLKGLGALCLQFIPCIAPVEERQSYYLDNSQYTYFLKTLFDLWYRDWKTKKPMPIRQFDNYLSILLNAGIESCDMRGVCTIQYVTEADGSLYPCDFYCTDDYALGNIKDITFEEAAFNKTAIHFEEESYDHPEKCKQCPYYSICRFGCKKQRKINETQGMENIYCSSYYEFFDYALPRLKEIAQTLARNQMFF